jgi:hypothetical protein
MSATITWVIEYMQCKPVEGSYTDVVITAGWRCNGAETVTDVSYTSTAYGTASFPMPEGSFTPYADLTQDQVLGWCWANGVDKTAVETNIQTSIDNQINPPVVTPPLPWITPPAVGA